jgi:ubiquinone/menaquinone biosynthesis C-methylase UbiE
MNSATILFTCLFLFGDSPRYEFRTDHDPDGSGKFYMGREIALVMGHEAAGWLDRPEREKEEKTSRLIKLMNFQPGEIVADVGAGSGYLTLRIAKAVGDQGKVFAVDIQSEMLDLISGRAKQHQLKNIDLVLGKIDDPKLPKEAVDTIIMVDVYHEFSHPYEMMAGMVKALRPGGRIAFVEYKLEDPQIPIKLVHKMSERQVIKEMEPFSLKHKKTYTELPWQHLIIFEKPKK